MNNITSSLNYVAPVAIPDYKDLPFNPDTQSKPLKEFTATPQESNFADDYARFLANKKTLNTAPVSFNRDLYKRYTDTYFGNSVFLDPRYYNNEEINAQRQSEWNKLGMGAIKSLPMAWSSFASFFTSTPWNYDNENTRELANIGKAWEDLFPNFYSQAELESKNPLKGFVPFVSDGWGNFWGDKMIKNLGFMGGAILASVVTDAAITFGTAGLGAIPGVAASSARLAMLIGRMGKSFKAAQTTAKALSLGKEGVYLAETALNAGKAMEMMHYLGQGTRYLGKAKSIALNFWAANAEASVESVAGIMASYETQFNDFKLKNGRLPTLQEEAIMKQIATDSGNIRYAMNVATIWTSNMIQFGNMFARVPNYTTGALGNTFRKGIVRDVGKGTVMNLEGKLALETAEQATTKAGKILQGAKYVGGKIGGKAMLADNLSEGGQEIFQFAFEKGQEDYTRKQFNNFIEGKYDPEKRMLFGDIISSQVYGMKEAFTSKEGWESFFIGFLTGYPIHGVTSLYKKVKGAPNEKEVQQKSIDAFNKSSLEDLFMNSDEIRTFMERDSIAFNEALSQQFIADELNAALENDDVFAAKTLKADSLINMVRSAEQLGKFDARLVQLETLKSLEGEAFEEMFGMEFNEKNAASASIYVDKLMQKAEEIREVVKAVDNGLSNPFDYKNEEQEFKAFESLKDTFIRNTVQLDNMSKRIPAVVQDILMAQPELSVDLLDAIIDRSKINEKFLTPLKDKRRGILDTLTQLIANRDIVTTPEERERLNEEIKNAREQLNRIDKHLEKVIDKTVALNEAYKSTDDSRLKDESLTVEEKNKILKELAEEDIQRNDNRAALTRELLQEVLSYKINEESIDDISKPQKLLELSKLDGIMSSIIDLKRLKDAMNIMLDENGQLQLPKGQKAFVKKFVGMNQYMQDRILAMTKRAAYKELLKDPINNADAQRVENQQSIEELQQLETLKEQIEKELAEKKEQLKEAEKELEQLKEGQLPSTYEENNKKIEEIDSQIKELEELLANSSVSKKSKETEEVETSTNPEEKITLDEITNQNAGTVLLTNGLSLTQEEFEKVEDEEITGEEAKAAVERNQTEVISNIVDEEVSEEEVETIAREENISKSSVKDFIKNALKDAIKNGSKFLKEFKENTRKILTKLLKFLIAGGVVFTLYANSGAVRNKVSSIVSDKFTVEKPITDTVSFNTSSFTVTSFDGCAAYIQNQVKHTVGTELYPELGLYGDAWTSTGNMVRAGRGTFVYNIFKGEKPALTESKEITSYINEKIVEAPKLTVNSFKEGDIINLFYEGSDFTVEAFKEGKDVYTSHLGIIKRNPQGVLVLEHNLHGMIVQNSLEDLVSGKLKSVKGSMSVSAIARPNYGKLGLVVATPQESKSQENTKSQVPSQAGLSLLALLSLARRKKKEQNPTITENQKDAIDKRLENLNKEKTKITAKGITKPSDIFDERIEELDQIIIPSLKADILALEQKLDSINQAIEELKKLIAEREVLIDNLVAENPEVVEAAEEEENSEIEKIIPTVKSELLKLNPSLTEEQVNEMSSLLNILNEIESEINTVEKSNQSLELFLFGLNTAVNERTSITSESIDKIKEELDKIVKRNKKKSYSKEVTTQSEINTTKKYLQKLKGYYSGVTKIQNEIRAIEEQLLLEEQLLRDLKAKYDYYENMVKQLKENPLLSIQDLIQDKLTYTKKALNKTNQSIEKTRNFIDKLKSFLTDIIKSITNIVRDITDTANFASELMQESLEDGLEFLSELDILETKMNSQLGNQQLTEDKLQKAEKTLNILTNKAIDFQNQIRWLEEFRKKDPVYSQFKRFNRLGQEIAISILSNVQTSPSERLEEIEKKKIEFADEQDSEEYNADDIIDQTEEDKIQDGEVVKQGALAPYSFTKTTQKDNTDYVERRNTRSGIYEGFLNEYSTPESIENFAEANNLQPVLLKANTDMSIYDGQYFPTVETLEKEGKSIKDEDVIFALVYSGTNQIANINRIETIENINGTEVRSISYEAIPLDEIADNKRGTVTQEDYGQGIKTTTVVSILQTIPKKEDKDSKANMASTRVFLKKSSDMNAANAAIDKSFKDLTALREQVAKDGIAPITIDEVTQGANYIIDTRSKKESISLSDILEFRYADVEVPLSPDGVNNYNLVPGKPYVILKNENELTEFVFPLVVPSLDTIEIGGKKVLDNIADILSVLQSTSEEDYFATLKVVNSAISASSKDSSLSTLLGDILYKPKKELTSNRIFLSKTEYIEISFNVNGTQDKKQYFVAKRVKLDAEGNPTLQERIRLDFGSERATIYSKEDVRKSINKIFKGVKINVRQPYLVAEKNKSFGYTNIDFKGEQFYFKPINKKVDDELQPIDYKSFLNTVGVRVLGKFQDGFDKSDKNQPFNRIGKGILFSDATKKAEELENQSRAKDKFNQLKSQIEALTNPSEEDIKRLFYQIKTANLSEVQKDELNKLLPVVGQETSPGVQVEANTSNQLDIEAQKAEIKRRQEELEKPYKTVNDGSGKMATVTIKTTEKEGVKSIKFQTHTTNSKGESRTINDKGYNTFEEAVENLEIDLNFEENETALEFVEALKENSKGKATARVTEIREGTDKSSPFYGKRVATVIVNGEAIDFTLKNDAELTALESPQQTDTEAKKADIERRRQEELFNIPDIIKPARGKNVNLKDKDGTWKDKRTVIEATEDVIKFETREDQDYSKFGGKGLQQEYVKKLQTAIEKAKKINDEYDAEYVDAVKKGEMTKEQAMQALEEVGRKDSSAYTELKALEQSKVETSSESIEEINEYSIPYTKVGKNQKEQIYTIRKVDGEWKIFNKSNTEEFKTDSKDRRKIFANLSVQQKKSVVVTFTPTYSKKGSQIFVVNKEGKILKEDGDFLELAENNPNVIEIKKLAQGKGLVFNASQEVKFESPEELSKALGVPTIDTSVTNETLTKEPGELDISDINSLKAKLKAKKSNKKGKSDVFDNLESSRMLERIEAPETTKEDIEKIKQIFGDNVNIEQLFDIANSNAWATWTAAAIKLYKGSNRSDLFHEAWHEFSQLYLTKEEKKALYSEVRNKIKSLKNATDLKVEEFVAREFSKFAIADGKYDLGKLKESKSIFTKIWNFLKKLFGQKNNSLENLFNILYKGDIKNYTRSVENILESKLNSEISDKFTAREAEKIKEVVDGLLGTVLLENEIPITALSFANNAQVQTIYEYVETEISDSLEAMIEIYESIENPKSAKAKKIASTINNLNKVFDNWQEVKEYHFINSDLIKGRIKSVSINEEGDFVSKEEDEYKKGKNSVENNEASLQGFYDIADPEVIALIQSLPELDKKGNPVLDEEYGTPKLANSSVLVNVLLEELAGTLPFQITGNYKNSMESKLLKLGAKFPTIQFALLPQLELFKIKPSVTSISVTTKFYKAFARPKNEIKVKVVRRFNGKDALSPSEYEYTNSLLINGKFVAAQADLRTNFFTYPEGVKSTLVSVNPEDQLRVIKATEENKAALRSLTSSLKDSNAISYLKQIGLYHPFFKQMNKVDAKRIIESVLNHLEEKGDITDIMEVLQSNYPEMIKIVRQIVEEDPSKASNVYYNADNELENEITNWSRINFLVAAINTFDDFNELVKNSEFAYLKHTGGIKNNAILSQFYNEAGKKINTKLTLKANNKNGVLTLKDTNSTNPEGVKTKALHIVEAAINDIQQLFKYKEYSTMQLSDKSSFYSIELPNLIYDAKGIDKFELIKAFTPILKDEMRLVSQFKKELESYNKQKAKNKDAVKSGDLIKLEKLTNNIYDSKTEQFKFGIFRDIFEDYKERSEVDLEKILLNTNLSESKINDLIIKNEPAIEKALVNYFTKETNDYIDFMNGLSSLGKDNKKDFINHISIAGFSPQDAVASFVINQFLFNIASADLIFGNTYSHKDPFKRIAGASGTGTVPITDEGILQAFLNLPVETLQDKFLKFYNEEFGVNLGANKSIERLKQTKFLTFKDEKPQSTYYKENLKVVDGVLKDLRKRYDEEKNNPNKDSKVLQTLLNNIKSNEAKRESIDRAYQKVNEADAFGAMSMDFFRRIANQMSIWNPNLEKIYKKSVAWGIADLKYQHYTDMLNDSSLTQAQRDVVYDKQTKAVQDKIDNTLSEEEIGQVEFTVQKFQYYGDVLNNSFHQVVFHKFELMPLIPQVISGTQWQKHAERMMIEDVDYAVFDSGSKAEKDIAKDNFYESETEEGKKNVKNIMTAEAALAYQEGKSTYNINTGNVMNLREQVKMDTAAHSPEIKFGTQIRKLVFNYYDEGEVNTGNEEFDAIIGQNKKEFDETIKELVSLEKENIYRAMTIDEKENGELYIKDKVKFVAFLKKEMEKKVINKEAYNHFQLSPQGEFVRDFDVSFYRRTLENVIVSIINNKLVSQKTSGEMKVQVTGLGFQSYREDNIKAPSLENGTNGLRSYYIDEDKNVRKMEVKVALKGDFLKLLNLTHSDGKPIKVTKRVIKNGKEVEELNIDASLDRLNEEIAAGKINSKSLTMVGYRIPTQEHNSIEVMEIAEFVHPLFGSGIIVPTEITAKAGSDFDIDKLNIFLPNLDSNGQYIDKKSSTKQPLIDNYISVKERNNALILEKKIELNDWRYYSNKKEQEVRQDIFKRIETLKTALRLFKDRKGILQFELNELFKEKNILTQRLHDLFGDFLELQKNNDKVNFKYSKDLNRILKATNSKFVKSLFEEYVEDISDETPFYDAKNAVIEEYTEKATTLVSLLNSIDEKILSLQNVKDRTGNIKGRFYYDSTGTLVNLEDGVLANLYSYLDSNIVLPNSTFKVKAINYSPEFRELYERIYGYTLDISEEINTLYAEKNQAFSDMINFKSSLQNRMIELISESVLNTNNFVNFITPNATYVYDDLMDTILKIIHPELVDSSGELNFDVKLTKMFSPLESYKKFLALLEQKEVLGISAQANVFSQLFRQANLKIADYGSIFNYTRDEEGNILLGTAYSVDGIPKSAITGQKINLNVDAANMPKFAYLNTGLITAPVISSMDHAGNSPLISLAFVNQPIIRKYANDLKLERESKIIDLKTREKDANDKITVKRIDTFTELVKDIREALNTVFPQGFSVNTEDSKGKPITITYSIDNLLDTNKGKFKVNLEKIFDLVADKPFEVKLNFLIRNIEYGQELKINKLKLSDIAKDPKTQKKFLLYNLSQLIFLKEFRTASEELADPIREVQDSVKYDTAKSLSAAEAQLQIDLFKKVFKSGKFKNLVKLRYESTTSPFAVQQDMIDILQFLMPVTAGREFNEFITEILATDFSRKPQADKKGFVRDFTAGFVQYIFQTMQNEDFVNQFKLLYNTDITKNKDGSDRTFEDFFNTFMPKFYTRLITLKNSDKIREEQGLPKLFDKYSLLQNTFINASPIKPEMKNIGIQFPSKEVKAENEYIDQWKELAMESGNINPNNPDSQTIKAFMEELALFGFLQSGLSYSYLAFSRIADNQGLSNLLAFAKEEFLSKVDQYGWQPILEDYLKQFKFNNNKYRKFVPDETRTVPSGKKDKAGKPIELTIYNTSARKNKTKMESFRGQLYTPINFAELATKEESGENEPDDMKESSDKIMDQIKLTPKDLEKGKEFVEFVEGKKVNSEQPINKEIKPNEVKGIEINSYQTGLGNSLTNVHYAKNGKSDFDIVPTDKSLKLTKEAKNKWGESVEAWYKSNNAQSKGIPEGVEGDKFDMDLMVGLITDKLTQYPNLVEQINQNGGLAFLQKSTHNMGSGRWSSKNSKNMFINSLIQAYKNVNQPTEIKPKIDSSKKIENLKRGDIINFQQQEFLVERVKNEGIDVRDVNTGDVDFISTEDYINETQEQPINKEIKPNELQKQNVFTIKPIQSADKKATIKASVANKYIGFGEGIANSSTELYRKQAGEFANVGNYNSNDVVFVSIGGKRGDATVRKEQQNKTIKEALKAIEAGATLITDNKSYVESSDYNEGEKRLAKNLEAKGYNYSEQTIDGQVLGVWNKNQSTEIKPKIDSSKRIEDLVSNYLLNELKKYNVKVEYNDSQLATQKVNAYYSSSNNTIYLPSKLTDLNISLVEEETIHAILNNIYKRKGKRNSDVNTNYAELRTSQGRSPYNAGSIDGFETSLKSFLKTIEKEFEKQKSKLSELEDDVISDILASANIQDIEELVSKGLSSYPFMDFLQSLNSTNKEKKHESSKNGTIWAEIINDNYNDVEGTELGHFLYILEENLSAEYDSKLNDFVYDKADLQTQEQPIIGNLGLNTNVQPKRRAFILDYLINKYDWDKSTSVEQLMIEEELPQERVDEITTMIYNEEQNTAIRSAISFIESGNSKEIFLIQGKAGTGKTTIAKEIAKAFPTKRIGVAALSNKAKKVIQDKFKEDRISASFYSIAGLLGQKMNMETGKFEREANDFSPIPISEMNLIFIDEASMVNEQSLAMIMSMKPLNAKVIFLGDIGQLPPIRTIGNPYYQDKQDLFGKKSPVFREKNIVKLEERVRQGEESPILPYADLFWENSLNENPKNNPANKEDRKNIINSKGVLGFVNSFIEIQEQVVDAFKKGIETNNPNHIKLVSYKNDTRESINKIIHDSLFGTNSPEFNPGELLIFNSPYAELFENADEVQILNVSDTIKDNLGLEYVNITIKDSNNISQTFPALLKSSKNKHKQSVKAAFDEAFSVKSSNRSQYLGLLKKAWALKDKFADVDYAYAITSHKSQGSTYDIVIVHEKDIMSVGATTNVNKSESIYTALTRPKNVAIIISSVEVESIDKNIEDLNSFVEKNKGIKFSPSEDLGLNTNVNPEDFKC